MDKAYYGCGGPDQRFKDDTDLSSYVPSTQIHYYSRSLSQSWKLIVEANSCPTPYLINPLNLS